MQPFFENLLNGICDRFMKLPSFLEQNGFIGRLLNERMLKEIFKTKEDDVKIATIKTLGNICSLKSVKLLLDFADISQYNLKKEVMLALQKVLSARGEQLPKEVRDSIDQVIKTFQRREGWILE